MFSLLFRNRWFAVGYVALTLISASLFAGRDGGADRLAQTTRQLQAQRQKLSQEAAMPPAPHFVVLAPTPTPALEPTAPDAGARANLQPLPGSNADPNHPEPGDEFINPLTGQHVRALRRQDAAGLQPAFPDRVDPAPGAQP